MMQVNSHLGVNESAKTQRSPVYWIAHAVIIAATAILATWCSSAPANTGQETVLSVIEEWQQFKNWPTLDRFGQCEFDDEPEYYQRLWGMSTRSELEAYYEENWWALKPWGYWQLVLKVLKNDRLTEADKRSLSCITLAGSN